MKKTLTVLLLIVLVMMMATTVQASASDDLLAFLSKSFTVAGEKVSLSAADKVKIERYLADNPVTESEASAIEAKVNETVSYLDQTGVSKVEDLTSAQKDKVMSLVNEAAGVIDLTVSYSSADKAFGIYKDGELIDSVSASDALATTGGINVACVVAVVAIIAVAATLVVKKVNE